MRETKDVVAGYIELGGLVHVTDPCYGSGLWCKSHIENLMPGRYVCHLMYADYMISCSRGEWESPVAKARIILDDGSDAAENVQERIKSGTPWRRVDTVDVESGMAGFFDDSRRMWLSENDCLYADEDYGICHSSIANGPDGFWTRSGNGDGTYDVYAVRYKGKIAALEIRFL